MESTVGDQNRINELERLAVENRKVLTCVFCGEQYPAGTPAWGAQVLVDHIKQCNKHPLKAVIGERELLRERIDEAMTAMEAQNHTKAWLILESAIKDTSHGVSVLMEMKNGS